MMLQEDPPHPPGTNNVGFHRKQFSAERLGCSAMALILGWAILGGFGEGWLSETTLWNDAETVRLDFERYARRDGPAELRLQFQPALDRQSIEIHLNREFIDGARIERVTPQYKSMLLTPDGATMLFDAESGKANHSIRLEYKPRRAGSIHVSIRAAAGSALTFDQFVYP
jgi:hypothetical protein